MIIEVESISKPTMIKPSSPTPDNLKHYELSFLDQMTSPIYNPMVFFYHSDNSSTTPQRVNHLKTSLSRALTPYHPLAGRVNGNAFVDCNDEGVPFLEARVACTLSALLADPDPAELNRLVPFELDGVDDVALGVQVSVFACGGVGVGVCMSHKVGDAMSFFMFVRTWAKIALGGEEEVVPPQFVAAELFPARSIAGFKPSTGIVNDKDNIVTKRFVFTASTIADIREKYSKSTDTTNPRPPSRVEALSSFIYSRLVSAADFKSASKRFVVIHTVNLRPRTDPPLPDRSFGNLYRLAVAFSSPDEIDGQGLVGQVRDSIAKIDGQYVRMLREGSEHPDHVKERVRDMGETVSFAFTSLCRFPVYEADFGWGGPAWVGSLRLTFKNLVVFVDSKVGGGIEAYVSLKKEVMIRFEEDEVFRPHVSPLTSVRVE